MKVYQALLPLAAAMMIAGCGSRSTAESVIGQAESGVNKVKPEAEVVAPAELKTAEATLAQMKHKFDDRDYKAVIADVPQFNAQMSTVNQAVASKQDATVAANQEWTTLSEEVPKAVDAIQARVNSLKAGTLPKEITKEALETATTELETVKTTWSEATAAATAGNTVEATNKAHIVQAKVEALKTSLGMNESETLASAG